MQKHRPDSAFSNVKKGLLFIKHIYNSRGLKGFGIHSPFLFHLVTYVVNQKHPYYCYSEIEALRRSLIINNEIIEVTDFGVGTAKKSINKRTIAQIAKGSCKPPKHAQILFRLVNHFQPKRILELGTSLGITTAYLAKVDPKFNVISLEGCPNISKLACENLNRLKIENVKILTGPFVENLNQALVELDSVDFVFFDGHHSGEATLKYFETCLPFASQQAVLVFDDLYLNQGMMETWDKIKQHSRITATLDFFHFGIAFLRPGLSKEHFQIRI